MKIIKSIIRHLLEFIYFVVFTSALSIVGALGVITIFETVDRTYAFAIGFGAMLVFVILLSVLVGMTLSKTLSKYPFTELDK
jgi:uncharacterized membrane protein